MEKDAPDHEKRHDLRRRPDGQVENEAVREPDSPEIKAEQRQMLVFYGVIKRKRHENGEHEIPE